MNRRSSQKIRARCEHLVKGAVALEDTEEGLEELAFLLMVAARGADHIVNVCSERRIDGKTVLQSNLERHSVVSRVHEERPDRL